MLSIRAKRIRCLVPLAHTGSGVFGAKRFFLASMSCVKVFRSTFRHRATETYLTERFVTVLGAEPEVYRRILNTISSLGTTLLQSGTLIPGQAQLKHECIVTCTPSNEQTLQCSSTQSQSKMRLQCSNDKEEYKNLTASKQATITLLDLHLSRNKCIFFLNAASNI